MKNNKEALKQMFQEIFANPIFNKSAIEKYFAPEYRQEVDGKVLHYEQFCKHVLVQKETIASMEFDFQTLVSEGNILFSNHLVTASTKTGGYGKIRVIAEFHFKNGQITYCNELTHLVSGNPEDRDIGSRY